MHCRILSVVDSVCRMAFDDAARFFQRYQYTPLFEPCQVILSKKLDDYQKLITNTTFWLAHNRLLQKQIHANLRRKAHFWASRVYFSWWDNAFSCCIFRT